MHKCTWIGRLCVALLMLTLLPIAAFATDEAAQEEAPLAQDRPGIRITSPVESDSVEEGNLLVVIVEGVMLTRIEVEATWDGGSTGMDGEGNQLLATLQLPPVPGKITITANGYTDAAKDAKPVTQDSVVIRTPREAIIEDMIALAYKNSKEKKYKFAPAQTDTDIGVCKNFVMRLFNTFKGGYYMLEYPDLKIHMPLNRRLVDCKPYQYGIEWAIEGPEDGSPFDIVAKFRYDDALSKDENKRLAREFLLNAKRGDFYQMVGNYVDGNGPHSLLMIADYDKETDMLRWTDSNMKGTRVNGDRWGYLQFDCKRTVEWMVKAICTKNRGATLYRLRDDLVKK